mmetsp:Transcript_52407/g.59906  ORF Transcript_52407/g.59906 Transcript_52407/m.59906 type:complete len:438 (-) Transcript_52407:172-1485(-)
MVLTDRQRKDLHKAIAGYLRKNGYEKTYEALLEDTQTEASNDPKEEELLEKKWSSVIRLQKKVMDMTAKVDQLQEELKKAGPVHGQKIGDSKTASQGLPKQPEKFELKGHRGVVCSVTFHPTYDVVATASDDATIKLWDYETGAQERSLKGHTGSVNCIDFDPSGNLLASSSADMTIKLWDFKTFTCIKTLNGHDHNVSSVQFVPNGDYLISASRDKTIKLWEVSTGFCKKTYQGHYDWVRRAIVNEEGTFIASCSSDETIMIWNIESTEFLRTLTGHENVIECIAFAPSGTAGGVIDNSEYHSSKNEEAKKNELENGSTGSSTINNKASTLANTFLVSGCRDKTIKIWDYMRGTCLTTLIGHDNWVRGLTFNYSGEYLISCADDKSIRTWDLKSGRPYRKIEGAHTSFVSGISMNGRYPLLSSVSVDHSMKIWECN